MVKVLDIPFFDKDLEAAVNLVLQVCKESAENSSDNVANALFPNHCISASGAHGLVEAHKDPNFKKILQEYWMNLPDGMPIVWIGKWKSAKNIARCYGPDFFKQIMIASANLPIKHFFCGGHEGVADQLKLAVQKKFGNHNVSGTFCPPFRPMTVSEMKALGNAITESRADIVWVAIGCPKQEKLAFELTKYIHTKFIIAVGAAFDFHTDRVKQAPSWVQQMGMEWLFRLLMEPRRLFKRYVIVIPLFIWLNLKELVVKRLIKII
jgi:N-acetylglucosaminyldiphosphoundecaprenol N-acetyl-beta-D-mannosaminyltransferase